MIKKNNMNNFKELQKNQEEEYQSNLNNIQNKLESNFGMFGLFAQLIDTYLTKIINCILSSAGGESVNDNNVEK